MGIFTVNLFRISALRETSLSGRIDLTLILLRPVAGCAALLLSFLSLASCSLLDLGEIKIELCANNPDICKALDVQNGISESDCKHYQCSESGISCVLVPRDRDEDGQPDAVACKGIVKGPLDCDDRDKNRYVGAEEICDSIDNDCDNVIDEGSVSQNETDNQFIALSEQPEPDGSCERDDSFQLTVASGGGSPLVAIVREVNRENKGWLIAPGDAGNKIVPLRYFYSSDLDPEDERDCPLEDNDIACDFLQLAFDNADGANGANAEIVTASVTGKGCASGRLRIGFAEIESARVHLGEGLSDESGIAFGVKGPECDGTLKNGVRHPVIAGLTANGQRQALVAWLQENNEHPRPSNCDSPVAAVPLQALGLSIGEPRNGAHPLLAATDKGTPQPLSETAGRGAPSLISWRLSESEAGYIIAYSNKTKEMEFATYAALSNPKDRNLSLPGPCLYPRPDLGSDIEQVALALGAPPQNGSARFSLLAVFRTGCRDQSKIRYALFEVNAAEYSRCSALYLKVSDDLAIPDGGYATEGPVLSYLETGYYSPPSGSKPSIGGWTVVWTERRGERDFLLASRVSEFDNRVLILEEKPMVLTESKMLSSPVTFVDRDGDLFFSAIDHCAKRPRWGKTSCVQDTLGETEDDTIN
ncbi:MAG: putative metal-binding motif-containing protein [Deltaproteobacteria bacterium]|nr:putative metal-binding motif-containing protein [Deltaproteobacteria bacterium]